MNKSVFFLSEKSSKGLKKGKGLALQLTADGTDARLMRAPLATARGLLVAMTTVHFGQHCHASWQVFTEQQCQREGEECLRKRVSCVMLLVSVEADCCVVFFSYRPEETVGGNLKIWPEWSEAELAAEKWVSFVHTHTHIHTHTMFGFVCL